MEEAAHIRDISIGNSGDGSRSDRDPNALPGLRRRRVFAWAIDVAICSLLGFAAAIPATFAGIVSFGVLWAPAWLAVGLIPLAYNALLVSGARRSTWGQRLAGIQLETAEGTQAGLLQAAAHFVIFVLSIGMTGGLILIWTFFNGDKALFHDTLVNIRARRVPAGESR